QRYSSRDTLELIEELNHNEAIRNLCIVINDISLTGYYGYGLRYSYNAGYSYYYGYNYYDKYAKSENGKEYYSEG
ncbi:MAG: hypothetical protein GT600_07920, partial [Bacteroidales bacterium]|nr:hypothetical protein [Bacteroidales bacterium]